MIQMRASDYRKQAEQRYKQIEHANQKKSLGVVKKPSHDNLEMLFRRARANPKNLTTPEIVSDTLNALSGIHMDTEAMYRFLDAAVHIATVKHITPSQLFFSYLEWSKEHIKK